MYLMKNTNLLKKKTEHFNNDISKTRDSNQKMRIQTDQKFQENKIEKLNSKYNAQMFCIKPRGGTAFAGEQKTRKLKKMTI